MRRARTAGRRRVLAAALGLPVAAIVAFTGCSGDNGGLQAQWNEASDKGYIEGDGSTLTILPGERTEPVEFSGVTESGDEFSSADTIGSVAVVNFWYAGCPPCRAEAPDFVELYDEFSPEGVQFVGVNTRDQVAQATQFSKEFGIEYPSIMDAAEGRAVQRAFAGQVPLNAVPTTLVLDADGRVAHRVLGQIAGASHLRTLINETLDEQ